MAILKKDFLLNKINYVCLFKFFTVRKSWCHKNLIFIYMWCHKPILYYTKEVNMTKYWLDTRHISSNQKGILCIPWSIRSPNFFNWSLLTWMYLLLYPWNIQNSPCLGTSNLRSWSMNHLSQRHCGLFSSHWPLCRLCRILAHTLVE